MKLVINLDADRNLISERSKDTPVRPQSLPIGIPSATVRSLVVDKIGRVFRSPLVLAWALAIGVTAFVAIMMLRPNVRFRNSPQIPSQQMASDNPSIEVPTAGTDSTAPPSNAAPNSSANTQVEIVTPKLSDGSITESASKNHDSPVDVPPATTTAEVVSVPMAKPDAIPKAIVAPPVKINVEELMKQRLQKFSTSRSINREQMIELIEEMLGAPIRYNREELGEKNLERSISIDLNGTTVGGVLKALLDSSGWDFVAEDDGIRLKPRQVAGSSSK